MKTLIELYDDRPLENVLSTEVFRPERTVFICSKEVGRDASLQKKMETYFKHRGVNCQPIFMECNMLDADNILARLNDAVARYEDCALDITGGTDDALFAAGLMSASRDIPVFTYSRKKNAFFNIRHAEFAEDLPCKVEYTVEDCFLMAGGAMRMGRVDNKVLSNYLQYFDPFFNVFLNNRKGWNSFVNYMQSASQVPKDTRIPLEVKAGYSVRGERNKWVQVQEKPLRALSSMGFIKDLYIKANDKVSFTFKDLQVRSWLRDVGSVLELYVYKACLDTGLYQDVRTSAVVDWEGDFKQGNVTNEIDVMATRGVAPVFISCKVCDVKTEALNELAILRDRFGGQMARAAIVTAERGGAAMRQRARELNIDVIDLDDLRSGNITKHLAALAREN